MQPLQVKLDVFAAIVDFSLITHVDYSYDSEFDVKDLCQSSFLA